MNLPQTLLIIGYVWPEPNSSAAGRRMMQLIDLFKRQQYRIIFASPASDSEYSIAFDQHQIEKVFIQLNDSSFDTFIISLNPSVVMFDRFMMEEQFGWRVAKYCPEALRILDTEDLHFLRQARQQAFKENRETLAKDLYSDMAKREIASIYRCDLSLIISEFEMNLLVDEFQVNKDLLIYFPLLFEPINQKHIDELPVFEQRKDFIFLGNFLHEPNWNAVLFLKEKIWPILNKKLPHATLQIYGAYPSQKVFALQNIKERFVIRGRAESSSEVFKQARVILVPVQFGAGLKGKLLEAMTYGTPSITSTLGAEGIPGNLDWPGAIENDIHRFVDAAAQYYENKSDWQKAQQIGFNIINSRFNPGFHESNFEKVLVQVQNNLEMHRHQNFTGAMLLHHTMASTKYLSKWIEEKNKKPPAD